jgi:hypothetical protein
MLTQESRSHAGIDAGENIKGTGEEEKENTSIDRVKCIRPKHENTEIAASPNLRLGLSRIPIQAVQRRVLRFHAR